jgi:hypothetical protein
MPFNPVTLTWEEDEIPVAVRPPGSIPPPTFYVGQGSAASGAPPPPPPVVSASAPAAMPEPGQPGILQALDVTQQQDSTTTGGTTKDETSGKVKTTDVRAALAEQNAAGVDLQAAADLRARAERAAADRDLAKLETEAAVAKLERQDAKEVELERIRIKENTQKTVDGVTSEYQAQAARQNDKFLDDATTGQKVLWGIGLLLGAFGAIKTGRNSAAEMLSDTVDKWDVDRRAKLETARKAVHDTRTWADKSVRDYLDDQIKMAPLKKAGFLLHLADKVDAELEARRGHIAADGEAKAMEFSAKARADAAKLRADSEKDFAPTSTTGGSTNVSTRTGTVVQKPGGGTSHPRTVLDRLTGKPIGLAPSDKEGAESRAALAQLAPIQEALDNMRGLVAETDWKDRVPVLGQWTDVQKRLKAQLDPILPMVSQITGSGTPQAGEAKRLLDVLTVGPSQSAEVTQQNIASLKRTLDSAYDARVKSLVPGAKTGTDAKPATNAGGGVHKMVNGKPATVYPDGTWEPR